MKKINLSEEAEKKMVKLDFNISLSEDILVPKLDYVDVDPALFRFEDGYYLMYGCGGIHEGVVKKYIGSSMDEMHELPNAFYDESFDKPHGDDTYWIGAVWVDSETGKWYAPVHVEYNYQIMGPKRDHDGHVRRIVLGVSEDEGSHWHNLGEIITGDNSDCDKKAYPGKYYDFGCGDHKMYVDEKGGYIYIWYMHAWKHMETGYRYQQVRVARCDIRDKMRPGTWKKWYQGGWNEPGIGGRDSDVFPNSDSAVICYNVWLHAYMAIGTEEKTGNGWIAICTDLDKQDWTSRARICGPERIYWYNWPVDEQTGSRYQIGQDFRIYSARCRAGGIGSKYMQVHLEKRETVYEKLPVWYPPESVPDGNEEYGEKGDL